MTTLMKCSVVSSLAFCLSVGASASPKAAEFTQRLAWKSAKGELVAEALFVSNDEEGRSQSKLLFVTPAGNQGILSHSYDAEDGVYKMRLSDEQSGWWLEYSLGLEVIGAAFPKAGDVEQIATLAREERLNSIFSVRSSDGLQAEIVESPATPLPKEGHVKALIRQLLSSEKGEPDRRRATPLPESATEEIRFLYALVVERRAAIGRQWTDLVAIAEGLMAPSRGKDAEGEPYSRLGWEEVAFRTHASGKLDDEEKRLKQRFSKQSEESPPESPPH